MDRQEILKRLTTILKKNQKEIGAGDDEITENIIPIGELTSFTSVTSVMITARCFEEFEIDKKVRFVSLFIGVKRKKGEKKGCLIALTIGEVADRILSLTNRK